MIVIKNDLVDNFSLMIASLIFCCYFVNGGAHSKIVTDCDIVQEMWQEMRGYRSMMTDCCSSDIPGIECIDANVVGMYDQSINL